MAEQPAFRRLRILAFVPSLATRLETAGIDEITVEIPWEDLEKGPVGEYVEVVDCDPASGVFYWRRCPIPNATARHPFFSGDPATASTATRGSSLEVQ